ncbi:hypothetical protein [Bordetella flabilis]|uniref:hypothetical protein n=1 Tax=Bordetella flabilis TaxID=463014 RepID=UPI000B31C466|nr:hypothetical protein [Bordetella flabilis]
MMSAEARRAAYGRALARRCDELGGDAGRHGAERGKGLARLAWYSGGVASVVSMAVLAYFGHREIRSALATANAPSHWIWRDEALRARGFTLRHTVAGYVIHHASSILWASVFERLLRDPPHHPARAGGIALAVAALAATVDLKLTPQRFTPGFEHHLSAGALAVMYGAFGAALFGVHALRGRVSGWARQPAPTPQGPVHRHR